MKVWLTAEKKGYNQLGDFIWLSPDYRDIDSKIYFSELKIVETPEGDYLLGMMVKDITNLSDKVDKAIFPLPVALWIHKPGNKYTFYSLVDKGNIEILSTPIEQIIWHQITEQLDVNGYYSGVISLESSGILLDKLLKSKSLRSEFPFILVEEIENLDQLKELRLESSKAGFDGKTSTTRKAQSELSKLDDRLQFVLQIASDLQGKKLEIADLYALSVGDKEIWQFVSTLVSLVIK